MVDMAETFRKPDATRRLSELLVQSCDWLLKDRLRLVHELALQVQTLHRQGRTHRAISADEVTVDGQLQPQLGTPPGPRRFGEEDPDPEFCPPQLATGGSLELPADIEAAAALLRKRGHALDPRRVDVYQLGTLLCRLLTGEPVLTYMYDPRVKARVPAVARSVLERALGEETERRFENCDELIGALKDALERARSMQPPSPAKETPLRAAAATGDDTPASGSPPAPESQPAKLPFERLGHYRIDELIGRGGMGDVYRGYDESLDRQVAVKVLPAELARDEDFVRRFRAEASAAAKLSHPNVVPVYFIGEDADYHFFAMHFVEGESLSARLARKGRLPLNAALQIVRDCLAGLEAAHEQGLIHRDIKPGNILLEHDTGRAIVVDFGLVRVSGKSTQLTATGVLMGTVDYIAPEQARGQKVDARADIYSVGVLLYQLLSGRLPFTAETPTAMVFQHAYVEPPPLRQAAPNVPRPVAGIVARMMAKSPEDRYSSCREVLANLEALRAGRRRRIAMAAVAAALIAVAALTAFLSRFWTPLTGRRDGEYVHYLVGHMYGVTSVDFSADGRRALSSSIDGTMLLWDVPTGQLLRKFRTSHGLVNCAAFSPDGRRVLSGGQRDFRVFLWDANTSEVIRSFDEPRNLIESVAFSNDGKFVIAAGADRTVWYWNAQTGSVVHRLQGHRSNVQCVAISHDGHRAASGASDRQVIVWDLDEGTPVLRFPGHSGTVRGLAFSADDSRIVSVGDDGRVILWEVGTQRIVNKFAGHTDKVWDVTFSPNGRFVASAGDTTFRVWNVQSGEEIGRLKAPGGEKAASIAWSPDGKHVLFGTWQGSLGLWRVSLPEDLRR